MPQGSRRRRRVKTISSRCLASLPSDSLRLNTQVQSRSQYCKGFKHQLLHHNDAYITSLCPDLAALLNQLSMIPLQIPPLFKIPCLLLCSICTYITFNPPNPPASDDEMTKFDNAKVEASGWRTTILKNTTHVSVSIYLSPNTLSYRALLPR